VRGLLSLLLIALTFSLAAGCSNDAPPMGDAVRGRDSLPIMISYGVSKVISDSGVMRYKIITEEWRTFDKTQPPRNEFPKGIFLERYDDKYKVNLHITADSAWWYDQKIWKLKGHVVLDDQAAQTHIVTEQLLYNTQTGEMASNTYTRLTQPDQEIEGNWFRATIINKQITHYVVRQAKGFQPMSGFDPVSSPASSAPQDTVQADTTPQRERPIPHKKSN